MHRLTVTYSTRTGIQLESKEPSVQEDKGLVYGRPTGKNNGIPLSFKVWLMTSH